MEKREDYSKWKKKGSKQVGVKSGKMGRLLQVELEGKQVGRSKEWKNGKITPSGRKEEVKSKIVCKFIFQLC